MVYARNTFFCVIDGVDSGGLLRTFAVLVSTVRFNRAAQSAPFESTEWGRTVLVFSRTGSIQFSRSDRRFVSYFGRGGGIVNQVLYPSACLNPPRRREQAGLGYSPGGWRRSLAVEGI